jgi:hypothetical protein
MSQPTVLINRKKYVVAEVSIVLKLNSAPLIYLQLSEDLTKGVSDLQGLKSEFFQDVCQEQQISFEWGGKKIELIMVGFRQVSYEDRSKHPSSRDGFELVGTAINEELTEWFNKNPFEEKNKDYLIYQKPTSGSSWSFFYQVLEKKFKQPNQDLVDRFELIFPDYGCIWRYKDSDNLCFLNRLVNYARQHLPEIQGWSAFDNENPFCLILFEEKKEDSSIPKLDQTWIPGSLFLPNRYSRNQEIDYSSVLSYEIAVKGDRKMALIEQLLTDGSNGENESKGTEFQEKDPIRLLYAPGTIVLGGRNMFCHTVSYQFTKSLTESLSVTIKIEVSYPQYQIGDNQRISLQLSSKFQQWSQTQEGEKIVEIAPLESKQWAMVNESDQNVNDKRFLAAQILSPTYSDDNHAGIYITHEKDDEMLVDIQPCEIPLVLGSVQKYRENLEDADVSINGKILAISSSSHKEKLDNAQTIIVDNSEIKLNHGKIVGKAEKKIDFSSQNVEIGSSQIEINAAQTKVNSLVNISSPSPSIPISSPSGVSGNAPLNTEETIKKNKTEVNISSPSPSIPKINQQKQASHIKDTPQYNNRCKQNKSTSYFENSEDANKLVNETFQRGTQVKGKPQCRELEFGRPIGIGPRGGKQTKVRIHIGKDKNGENQIHGHPAGQEKN